MFPVSKALGVAASACLLFAGCAGEPRPAEDLARAKSLVQQADAANVQRYAAPELTQARDKLQLAEKADAEKKNDVARRRANEAAADAELAAALSRSRELEYAAGEQQKSLETLRQEVTRGTPATTPHQ
jgi:flagellar motility protein MotE (MotC chaperone)